MKKERKVYIDCFLESEHWRTISLSGKGSTSSVICDIVIARYFNLYECDSYQKAKFTWVKSNKGALCYVQEKDHLYRKEEGGFDFDKEYWPYGSRHTLSNSLNRLLSPLFDGGEREIRCDLYMELID